MNKVLFLLTNTKTLPSSDRRTGLWIEEYAEPFLAFDAAGLAISCASPNGGAVPIDPESYVPDGRQPACIPEILANQSAMAALDSTMTVAHVSPHDYAGLYIPGGHGTMWDLPNNSNVQTLVAAFLHARKPVAAVCHGPAALVGLSGDSAQGFGLEGLRLTAFSNAEEARAGLLDAIPFTLEDWLKSIGADYHCSDPFAAHVEVADNLITGQNPASSAGVITAFLDQVVNR